MIRGRWPFRRVMARPPEAHREALGAYWAREPVELLRQLAASDRGLSSAAAEDRLRQFGRNELVTARPLSRARVLWNQVRSPLLLGRAVLPGMRAAGFGRIVGIDSEVADRPPPGRSAYVTAKSAQIGLTRSWARELAPYGITVNTVAPGFVPVERHADVADEIKAAYRATVPARRLGTPEDVAHAVSFFASDAAGFITGQRLLVDGGRGLRD